MCCSYRHQHFLNYHLFCCADSPRNYKCKDDVGLWNGDLIDRLKLRPPLNDVDAAARCRSCISHMYVMNSCYPGVAPLLLSALGPGMTCPLAELPQLPHAATCPDNVHEELRKAPIEAS